MIKKRNYFFLFLLLYTNVFFAANKIIISPAQDSISLSSNIILINHAIVYSNDESRHTPVVKEPTQTVIYIQQGAFLYTTDGVALSENVHLKHSQARHQNCDKQTEIKPIVALKKKQKVIKNKTSKMFFENANSSQNIFRSAASDPVFCLIHSNNVLKNEVIFHYSHSSIQPFLYLEKSHSEFFFISSEFSEYYFSRPPPLDTLL